LKNVASDLEKSPNSNRLGKWLFAIISLSIVPVWLVSLVWDPMEAGRLRNALIAEVGQPADFAWSPQDTPLDFKLENGIPSPKAREALREAQVMPEQSGFEKALALARHLLQKKSDGEEIKSDFDTALSRITDSGTGDCADFSQVMIGLLNVAGVPARRWGFSVDGYGSNGHAFIEIYDEKFGWIFLDVFNGFYVRDTSTGIPLSTLDFRDRLASGKRDYIITKIKPGYFGFRDDDNLINYFSDGLDQYFLAWGTNLFEYEGHPLVKLGHKFSHSVEQLIGITTGIYPKMKILPVPGNSKKISALLQLKWKLYFWLFAQAIILMAWLVYLLNKRSDRV
jgi:transglutaminase-like putative cysteine protease